jgi:hypothetical protein
MLPEPEEANNEERAVWTAPQMRVLTLRDIDTLADIEVAFTFQFTCPSGDL